MEAFQNDL